MCEWLEAPGLLGFVECSVGVKGFRGVGDGGCCEGASSRRGSHAPR